MARACWLPTAVGVGSEASSGELMAMGWTGTNFFVGALTIAASGS